MTTRYATLWDAANRLRSDPKAWVLAYRRLQAELEREVQEVLRVEGVKLDRGEDR